MAGSGHYRCGICLVHADFIVRFELRYSVAWYQVAEAGVRPPGFDEKRGGMTRSSFPGRSWGSARRDTLSFLRAP